MGCGDRGACVSHPHGPKTRVSFTIPPVSVCMGASATEAVSSGDTARPKAVPLALRQCGSLSCLLCFDNVGVLLAPLL